MNRRNHCRFLNGDRHVEAVSKIINQCGLAEPDGRPLHAYDCSPENFAELTEALRSNVAAGSGRDLVAAGLVFWAAEHIRANFSGGPLTWEFVFSAIDWPEDQDFGRQLTEKGLTWWGREIRVSDAGTRMFLYSLMAEGGIPEALLSSPGLYRDVVLGLLKEIEAEGGTAAESWSDRIAERWIVRLPQTFQYPDIARLLAGLALSLAALRADLPADLPEAATERWLKEHRDGWISCLPLRSMTAKIAETLIHPALRAERESPSAVPGPLCKRELRRDETGAWHGYLALNDDGWLPASLFPDAEELRLRLLPAGTKSIDGLTYSAAPEGKGWRLRRFGGTGGVQFPFHPQEPFTLAAFADGRMKGEAVIDPGFPAPEEAPSFWRSADRTEGATAQRLTPLSSGGKTRAACLWLMTSQDVEPETDTGLMLEEPKIAPGGFLWRISGKGDIKLGKRRYRIETDSEDEALEARFTISGKILRGWRLQRDAPVYQGKIVFFGQIGASPLHRIPEHELQRTRGQLLFSEIVEWVRQGATLASFQLFRIPESTHFGLRETSPGQVTLKAEGLESEWRVTMRAGGVEKRSDVVDGAVKLSLETQGMAPGLIDLRLSEPVTGTTLNLQAPWPARSGMILDPEGERLLDNRPISVEGLYGWRVVVPEASHGDLQLQLTGQRAISLPVAGEGSLTAHRPLIKAMLAQGGPDAQVNLSLVVTGDESRRLEIRRYHERTVIEDGFLRVGLGRDAPITPSTDLTSQLRKSQNFTFHAVDMSAPECCVTIPDPASASLHSLLGDTGGPWLIQPCLEGRVQRAVVWNPRPTPETSRDERIKIYAEEWRRLVSTPEDPEWERLSRLITAAGQRGDAGVLDEVQALAQVPKAAISMALRIYPYSNLWEIRDLDTVAPIFWPTVPVADFTEAVQADRKRILAKLSPYFDGQELENEADRSLAKRISQISMIMPELAGHFGRALVEADLFHQFILSPELQEMLKPLLLSNPRDRLTESAQDAVRRFDRLPSGVRGLEPLHRPAKLSFNPYAQSVIDAPLVAAEIAAGRKAEPSVPEKLTLINLRLVDPIYFDTALPAALHLLFAKEAHA